MRAIPVDRGTEMIATMNVEMIEEPTMDEGEMQAHPEATMETPVWMGGFIGGMDGATMSGTWNGDFIP